MLSLVKIESVGYPEKVWLARIDELRAELLGALDCLQGYAHKEAPKRDPHVCPKLTRRVLSSVLDSSSCLFRVFQALRCAMAVLPIK